MENEEITYIKWLKYVPSYYESKGKLKTILYLYLQKMNMPKYYSLVSFYLFTDWNFAN